MELKKNKNLLNDKFNAFPAHEGFNNEFLKINTRVN